MKKQLTESLLSQIRENMTSTAEPIAVIELYESDNILPWQSNFTGKPYLPKGMTYPIHPPGEPLRLLIQINFSEMPPLPNFPVKGILQIFIDSSDEGCFGLFDKRYHHIVYHPDVIEDITQLQPEILINEEYEYFKFVASAIKFTPELQYNNYDEDYLSEISTDNAKHLIDINSFRDLHYRNQQSDSGNYISGNPFFYQYDPRYECGIIEDQYGEEELKRIKAKYKRLEENVLLLQLDGKDKRFADSFFSCNFFIHPDDLRNLDFSHVYAHLDTD